MKICKNLLLPLALFAFTLSACGNAAENTDKTGKEYTSAYVCPMHCEGSGSDASGKCPVCEMDYVKLDEHKADGHQH